jgi:hypothetical protein
MGWVRWKSSDTTLRGLSMNSWTYSKVSLQNLTTPSSPPVASTDPSGLNRPSFWSKTKMYLVSLFGVEVALELGHLNKLLVVQLEDHTLFCRIGDD